MIKKRVAILTYHRAINYGSILQAYALQETVSKLNFDSFILDFCTKKQLVGYSFYEKTKSVLGMLRNVYRFFYRKQIRKKFQYFQDFLIKDLRLDFHCIDDIDKKHVNADYYICGSDQIWNLDCFDFSVHYLLDFVVDKNKCISYAPSLGSYGSKLEFDNEIVNRIRGFKLISVREKRDAILLSTLLKRDVECMPDPVFLMTKEDWLNFISKGSLTFKKYILCYFIGNVDSMRDYAKKISKKYKMPLIVTNESVRDLGTMYKKRYDAGPKQFLSLINNASYVISNSFHATAFSIIFEKQFAVFLNKKSINSNNRIIDLLAYFDLSNHIYETNDPLSDIIDFKTLRRKKTELMIKGLAFLSKGLTGENNEM